MANGSWDDDEDEGEGEGGSWDDGSTQDDDSEEGGDWDDEDSEEDDEDSEEDDEDSEEDDEDSEEDDEDSEEDDWQDAEPVDLDEDVFGSRDEYPDATDEDFEDDPGDWSEDDYRESAQGFFGRGEFWGDTVQKQFEAAGFSWNESYNQECRQKVAAELPGAASGLNFFQRDGQTILQGLVTAGAIGLLQRQFPSMDFSFLQLTLPRTACTGETPVEARPLPPALAAINPADKVDLRKYCTPVADQKQTYRCAAFAWTHALEMAHHVLSTNAPLLCANYTMMQIQRRQGDFKDYRNAWKGGDGCALGIEVGDLLVEGGTCRRDLWPDDDPNPRAQEGQMTQDALQYRLPATVHPIALDDLRRVLSAGCPVRLVMTTGPRFAEVGRDGVVDVAEEPSGDHGYHAMLIVGYIGNYFIVKNSWGTDWGDQGYCYLPKKVLQDSEAELVAVLLAKPAPTGAGGDGQPAAPVGGSPGAPAAGWGPPAAGSPGAPAAGWGPPATGSPGAPAAGWGPPAGSPAPTSAPAHVTCPSCHAEAPASKFCVFCGKPLKTHKFCAQCGQQLSLTARFCVRCGEKAL